MLKETKGYIVLGRWVNRARDTKGDWSPMMLDEVHDIPNRKLFFCGSTVTIFESWSSAKGYIKRQSCDRSGWEFKIVRVTANPFGRTQ